MNTKGVICLSWTNELCAIYDLFSNYDNLDSSESMLPLSHSTAKAQVELVVNENGDFVSAYLCDKEDAKTVIPVSEDSGARSSGICPMPYADKLVYLTGDYEKYIDSTKSNLREYFETYMKQLVEWKNSEDTHPAVCALYKYLQKESLVRDLINSGIIELKNEKIDGTKKIDGISQTDLFVRVRVNYDDIMHESRTWSDKSLQEAFISYNSKKLGNAQLCYISGEFLPISYKHPKKIRNEGDQGKLFSTNDENGFTYRGRFWDKEQAVSVSYEYSQKIHTALKWLIKRQGVHMDSLTLVAWASALKPIPNIIAKDEFDNEFEDSRPDSLPAYKEWVKKNLLGFKREYNPETKAIIMGLDAATTGRLSISLYSEIESSSFLKNIEKWHGSTAWNRYIVRKGEKTGRNAIKSVDVYEIAECAFGTEKNNYLECDSNLKKDTVLRLIPCVIEGKKIPRDIVSKLAINASKPLAYKHDYLHRKVLEVACAMIRKKYDDYEEGDIGMEYDSEITDRSYLYGCLLAIADVAERSAYGDDEKERITHARRYWSAFAGRPYQVWKVIEEGLRVYLDKAKGKRYDKMLDEIMVKFEKNDFADNSALSPMYLLGYHQYSAKIYSKKQED